MVKLTYEKKYSYSKNDINIYPFETTDVKTTNINILLNRVRQTKKHNTKKKYYHQYFQLL